LPKTVTVNIAAQILIQSERVNQSEDPGVFPVRYRGMITGNP